VNELVSQIAQRTGIGEDKAQQAAETVISFLKSKFPSFGGQLDSLMQGGSETSGMTDRIKKSVGGVFGKKSA
jgi:hypothetical protein